MSFCCKDLFQLKYFSKAKLIAGENGLDNQISLPYVRTTESISNWLYGGELLFVIYKDESENISLLLEECIQKKLAGIVILIDEKNLNQITEDIINRANKKSLPLFIMPWDIKLIDIIQEIFLKIEQKREEAKNGKHFLESLLFSQDHINDNINVLAEFYNIKLRPFHYISILKMRKSSKDPYDISALSKSISSSLEDILKGNNYTLIHMEYANYILSLVFSNDYEDAKKSIEYIESGFNLMSSKYSENVDMNLSFSRIRESDSNIKASYKEAFKALSMIDMYDNYSKVIKYNELGIIRLFIELAEIKDVYQYCYENIGPILEYDKNHGMNLLETLKCYFKNNRHLLKTSQELFIHRNTLLYRLSTIKNLLQRDLDDAMTDLELFNSILIFEFLNLQNKL